MAWEASSMAGATSLSALTGILADAALVISNDSGPLHLAAATGTATVGIYWCGNAINGGPPAVHRHRKAISWRLHCPECGVDCTVFRCAHEASFVDDVPVAAVVDEALDLLDLAALEAA
jgi:ADP-heptose:LPS heptosyltransferase